MVGLSPEPCTLPAKVRRLIPTPAARIALDVVNHKSQAENKIKIKIKIIKNKVQRVATQSKRQ